ncbi:MAG: ABC transporter ATP-binding protein [Trueperaceae bacterium]|nr:ABC transporter ATP-binding protein [Trueperaceae bacterium]
MTDPPTRQTGREAGYAISTHGLTKRFGDLTALDALDLRVPRHSVFGFLGPNGAGKTTAMRMLVGLSRPSEGHAEVLGRDATRDSLEVRRRVGFLAQDPRFYEHQTARETLRFTARFFYAGPARAIEERIDEMLDLVGLTDKADRPIRGFSGGERQRLGIAQAQVNAPELLIMDEPAAALDPVGRHAVLSILDRLRAHTTVLFSTHILDDVQRVADHVAILNRGRLIAQAPTRELLAGDGAATYLIGLERSPDGALAALRALPWVADVGEHPTADGGVTLHVAVHDEAIARTELLRRVLATPDAVVTHYRRRSFELEEVFMELVKDAEAAR